MKVVDKPEAKKALDDIIQILNKANLTISDQVLVISNLIIATGASLAGFKGEVPDIETLKQVDLVNPTVDISLMLQGLLMTKWAEDFEQKPVLSDLANKLKK